MRRSYESSALSTTCQPNQSDSKNIDCVQSVKSTTKNGRSPVNYFHVKEVKCTQVHQCCHRVLVGLPGLRLEAVKVLAHYPSLSICCLLVGSFFFPFVHNVKLLSGNINLPKNYSLSWPHNEPPSALLVLPQLCGAEGGSGYHQPSQNMFAPGTGQGIKSFLKAPTIPKHINSHSHLLSDLSVEISPCFHGLVTACLTLTLDIPAVHHVIWCCQADGEL